MTWLKYVFAGAGVLIVALLIYVFTKPDFKVPTPPGWNECDEFCHKEGLKTGEDLVCLGGWKPGDPKACLPLPQPEVDGE